MCSAAQPRARCPRDSRRDAGATSFGHQGEEKLQFEVNGQDYFLNFVEDERRWFVLVPTETGVTRIPVYVDVQDYERIGLPGNDRQNRLN
jgi:hypothetical protein